VIPWTGKLATPQLIVIFSVSRAKAVRTSARSRSASRKASASSVSGASTPNSSPPRRATTSLVRVARRSACASMTSARSPALCPKRSLYSLNQSRSSTSIESGRAVRVERSSSAANRSSSSRRFAS
jgi:hypothetical protein